MLINFGKIANNLKGYISSVLLLLFIILCFDVPYANWYSFIAFLIALYAICLNKIIKDKIYWLLAFGIILSLTICFNLILI